jgi:hypothetical protein
MEVGDDLSTALGTETLGHRDTVAPSFDYTPGLLGRYPTYRGLRAPELSVERSIKKLITLERNTLADDTIKACGCLKVWWDQGLTRGQHDV